MSMSINTKKGDKIIVTQTSARNGYHYDIEAVQKHLEVGVPYTIQRINVTDWTSSVLLVEVKGIWFNTVNFENFHEEKN